MPRSFAAIPKAGPLALALFLASAGAAASEAKPFFQMTEAERASAVVKIHAENPSLQSRVEAVSTAFLGTPYRLGPLGEGREGQFDRDPLVDFQAVDCTTFVEQVMALSLEPDLRRAVELLQKIRYRDGQISYETRNHFASVDWIPNNAAAGFITDTTRRIGGGQTRVAVKTISKRGWYSKRTEADLADFPGSPAEKERLLTRFRALGDKIDDQTAELPYLPAELFPKLLKEIPSGSILNLVRQNMPDIPVLISHQALLIQKPGGPFIRHAHTSDSVVDMPALEYFRRYEGSKWPLLGVNVNGISQGRMR
jgi:hypothetical protein